MNYLAMRHLREAKHLSQTELASASGVSERTIRAIESGHNTTPSQKVLDLLGAVLCPDDPQLYQAICNESVDYKAEKHMLDRNCRFIPAALIAPLNKLFDPQSSNAVSYSIACMAGYLRANPPHKKSLYFVGAVAATMSSVTPNDYPAEFEFFNRGLITHLEMLANNTSLPREITSAAKGFASHLSNIRLNSSQKDRLNSVRTVFCWLYDHWEKIEHLDVPYYILSDVALICDHAADKHVLRCTLFYGILNFFLAQN